MSKRTPSEKSRIKKLKRVQKDTISYIDRFEELFETAPVAIYEVNLNVPRFVNVNEAMCKMSGYSKEELLSINAFSMLTPASAELFKSRIKASMAGHKISENVEYQGIMKGGRIIDFILNVKPIMRNGRFEGALVAGYDITERKKAEENLQNLERLLSAVTSASTDAIYVKDRQSRWLFANPALERITRKTSLEILGKTDAEIYPNPEIGQGILENDREVMETGKAKTFEEFVDFPDGRHFFISVKSPRFDEKGNVIGIVGISHDITERKKAEKENADLSRFPLENPAAVLRVDRQGIIMFANPPAQSFLKEWQTKVGQSVPERVWKMVADSLASNSKIEFEEKIGEEIFSFLIAPIIPEGYANLYGRGITKRKKAEEKLQEYTKNLEIIIKERTEKLESNALYTRSLIEASLDPLVTINTEGKITDVNNATEFATGCSREELIGSNFSNYFTEPDRAAAGYKQAFTKGYVKDYPLAIRHKSGKATEVLYNATVYRNVEGQVQGVFAAARDITERKTLEKKLAESERLAAIGATAGMVGHDIRNPLQAITSDVYLAKSELQVIPNSEEKKNALESLDEIAKNTEYINKIVQDLQDYARPLSPRLKEIDIENVLREVATNKAVPKNIKVTLKIQKTAKTVTTDPDMLKRLLANLVNNAVQAMPQGGRLSLQTFREAKNTVITVKDTGVGIPEEIKPRLFKPLFTTKSKGQGFGLAVVKRLTEALGGKVSFESELNKGTKFMILLPAKQDPE